MPIDPSILSTIGKGVTPIDTPDEVALRQARLAQARETVQQTMAAARQRQKAVQDDQDFQDAIRSNLGPDGLPDYSKVVTTLFQTNPDVAQKTVAGIAATRKTAFEAEKLVDDHRDSVIKATGQLLNDANEENWPVKFNVLQQVDPQAAAIFGNGQWTPDTAQRIKTFQDGAIARKDWLEQKQKATEYLQSGKPEAYVGQRLLSEPNLTADRANDILRDSRDRMGVDSSVTSGYASLPVPAMLVKARNDVLGQKEVETLTDTQARNAQLAKTEDATRAQAATTAANTAANEARTRAQEDQRIALERQRVGLESKRLDLSGGTADPEMVAGYVRQVVKGDLPLQGVPAATRGAVVKALASTGQDITKLTAQGKQMKETATVLLPMIDKVQSLATQVDKMGLMGTVGGRWRSLVSGESSASNLSGLTPAQKQIVGEFASAGGLLITGIARAHGGARAGGSPQMIEHLGKLMDASTKDLPTFIGNLNGERDFMENYAHMGDVQGTPAAPAGSSSAASKMLRFGTNAPFSVTKQPDGTWKSDSGAIYDDSGKRIK